MNASGNSRVSDFILGKLFEDGSMFLYNVMVIYQQKKNNILKNKMHFDQGLNSE